MRKKGNEMKKTNANGFFAMFFRQKYINRWGLMRNMIDENLSTHASEVACIAHALAVIGNTVYGKNYDENRVAVLSLYHDTLEVYTGDMPTPVKYATPELRSCYSALEKKAVDHLVEQLPEELRGTYQAILEPKDGDEKLYKLVKAADKLCAYIKCIDEERCGNTDFANAKIATQNAVEAIDLEELDYFKKHFLPSFSLTLDEL